MALKCFWRKGIFKIRVFILSMESMKFVDCKSWCVFSSGNRQQIREDVLDVPLWLPHQNAIKLLQHVESQKENTCFNILAAILILPSWPDSSCHDYFFTSGSLQGKSLGPVLSSFSKGHEISLFSSVHCLGNICFHLVSLLYPVMSKVLDRGLKLFYSTCWLQALMTSLSSAREVMMGRSQGNRKLLSFHQKNGPTDREISICC